MLINKEYIFVSVFVIVIGTIFAKSKRINLISLIEEFIDTQSANSTTGDAGGEDIVELEEIRDIIFDFVVINSKKFSNINYNESSRQSGTEKVS